MAMSEFIRAITEKVDIVEVVSRYVNLKKRGKEFVGLCPFHKERTPSFYVSPTKGVYHCFGCKASGNVVTFLAKMEGIPLIEAAKKLAKEYGIQIPKTSGPSQDEKLYQLAQEVAEFFHSILFSPAGDPALVYLTERGVEYETIKDFLLGYAPYSELLKKFESEAETLEKIGLVKRDEKGFYEFFKDRLIFPIFSPAGKVVGFGGRTLKNEEPKYLNTPNTQIYDKSWALYGIHKSWKFIKEMGYATLMEGYFDVLLAYQKGFKNCVATCGTSLTHQHAKLLKRFTDKVLIVYDGDSAGKKAAVKAGAILRGEGFKVMIALIENEKDPADLLNEMEHEEFLQYLREHSKPFFEFAYDYFKELYPPNVPGNKAMLVNEMAEVLSEMENEIQRFEYIRELSKKLDVPEGAVLATVLAIKKGGKTISTLISEENPVDEAKLACLSVALESEKNFKKLKEEFPRNLLEGSVLDRVIRHVLNSEHPVSFSELMEACPEASEILGRAVKYENIEDKEALLRDSINFLKRIGIQREIDEIKKKIKELQNTGEIPTELLQELHYKVKEIKTLGKEG